MQPEFARVPFRDPAKSESNIERLGHKLTSSVMGPLASLLMLSPEPDGALNLLDRYVQTCPPEVLEAISRAPTALTYLVTVFGHSTFLAEAFLAEPALAVQFARDRNFTKLKSQEDLLQDFARFATTNPDPWLSSQLARFKRRNYVRIALKDMLGLSTLGETTLELSSLADVILANALAFSDQELNKRYGGPQYRDAQGRIARSGFSVVSLGKLGGNELNYSSDIDLLFLYSRDGETSGAAERSSIIANKEYFVRLAHGVTRTVTQTTPHGQVFRVDLRLRPEGDQGDLAISVKSAMEYYRHRARDWELQMLIKARHSAGDARLTRDFLRGVEPYVYGASTDFAAVESILWAREKISPRLRESRGAAIDVKRHRGGIRDIEFLTQCLQRLYGRDDPWVRSGGTLHALRKLNDKGQLGDREFADLTTSYEFLRQVEHCVQLDRGQQTHRLPAEAAALDRLARRVSPDETGRTPHPGPALLHRLQKTFDRVDEIYQRVIHPRAGAASRTVFGLQPPPALVADYGPSSYEATLRFLDVQAPELAAVLRDASLSERARPNAARLFAALLGTSERFAAAREQPQKLKRALEVMATSDHLAELLIHHPEDVQALDSAGPASSDLAAFPIELSPAPAEQMEIPLDCTARFEPPEPFPWATDGSLHLRQKMALLRKWYRTRAMALGARDVTGMDSIFASLARWSILASRAITTAMVAAAAGTETGMALAVLGLGRLGLQEFDLGSDADLVFIAPAGASREDIACWTHLAERTIEILSSYTSDGIVFAVDTRLRPRGQEGELVVTEDALANYIGKDAHVWEALTYLKACPVAGNRDLGARAVRRLLRSIFDRFTGHPQLEAELHQMRRRLEREVMVSPSNTKTAPGGYYDVDFAVSYLRLGHRVELAAGANTATEVAALRDAGLIASEDARTLAEGAAFLRSVDHAIRLVTGRAGDGLPEHVGHAEAVEDLARRWKLTLAGESLAEQLRKTQQEVRYAYRRLVGSE